jgi:hypothetical protein
MSSLGKSWSGATLACPRLEHAGSRVRFDGLYGKPGHRRQRYRCVPANGDRPHRFAGLLPREESWTSACEMCERSVSAHEGPHAAREYQFVARGIAGALKAVGAGASYRKAAFVARERAQRMRIDSSTGEIRWTRHGSLVMDWVEMFAPVVFVPYRRSDWPTTGSLLLDDVPFRIAQPNGGTTRIAFRVFCAMGYEGGHPRMWRMQAFSVEITGRLGDVLARAQRLASPRGLRQRPRADRRRSRRVPGPTCICVSGISSTPSIGCSRSCAPTSPIDESTSSCSADDSTLRSRACRSGGRSRPMRTPSIRAALAIGCTPRERSSRRSSRAAVCRPTGLPERR